jgi:hypothetical protein
MAFFSFFAMKADGNWDALVCFCVHLDLSGNLMSTCEETLGCGGNLQARRPDGRGGGGGSASVPGIRTEYSFFLFRNSGHFFRTNGQRVGSPLIEFQPRSVDQPQLATKRILKKNLRQSEENRGCIGRGKGMTWLHEKPGKLYSVGLVFRYRRLIAPQSPSQCQVIC